MNTDSHEPTHHGSVNEGVPHHTATAPLHQRFESLPDQRLPATIIPLPARSKPSRLPSLVGIVMIILIGGDTMMLMLMSIASISLIVGGIGIMNILLVSVTERTREIGLRIVVGAKRGHILLQFLTEAIIMTAIGGVLGVGTGIGIARLLTAMIGWPTIINVPVVAAAFLFSFVVGIFFGLYPANKASKLNPIEALRYE